MSKPLQSLWTGGGFIGGDQSANFVDRSRPIARVDVLNAETPEQVERALGTLNGVIYQFWTAADTQHQLSGRDHAYYRQRVAGAELAYFAQAGQPVIQVRADPIVLEEDDPFIPEPPEAVFDPGRPFYIERPQGGFVYKRICYETLVTFTNFLLYPRSLWFTPNVPIPPLFNGTPGEVNSNIAQIEAAYAALSPEDAETQKLVRIVRGDYDLLGSPRSAYAVVIQATMVVAQQWQARPPIELPDMNLLPVEPDLESDTPPEDQVLAPPQSPEEAQQELESAPLDIDGWPLGSTASVHDYFQIPPAPGFQEQIVNQNGDTRVILTGTSWYTNLPDEPLNTCGITYEQEVSYDDWGHPLSSQPPQGENPNKYWMFAPLTFWRPDGSQIIGPHPTGIEGIIPQEPPYDPMSNVSPDFLFWLQRL